MAHFTLQHHLRVYNDTEGSFIEVSPDGDGLDLVEISSRNRDGEIESSGHARVTMPLEQARLVHTALGNYLERVDA